MKRNKVLIVTSKDDTHSDHIINSCNELGKGNQIVRVNTEDFVSNCLGSFDGDDFALHLKDSDRILLSQEIRSVWYRRPAAFELEQEADEGIREFVRTQSNAFLRGFYFCCHDDARWINPLPAIHRSRIKLQQIQLARRIGLKTPKTLVTNVPTRAIEFAKAVNKICTKSLDEPSYSLAGFPRALFTRVIESPTEIEADPDSISRCPVLLQEYIEKCYDLRVAVFGQKLFAFEIHSQTHPLAVHDFRGVAPNFLEHSLHQLPEDIAHKILLFVKKQGLVFSVLDLVYSVKGEYVFLENNSNGQWLWLEFQTGVNLTEAMIKLLFD